MSVVTMGDELCDAGLGLKNGSVQTKEGKTVDNFPVVEPGSKDYPDDSFWNNKNNWGGD